MNQYGASFGGPIPFFRFGDSGGSLFDSGKDKRFFYVNYEEFRLPQATARTRTIMTTEAQSGIYRYISGGVVQSMNLLQVAQAGLWIEPEDADQLVARVLALSNDKELCQRLGMNGRRFVMEHFDRIVLARKLVSAIEIVCGRSPVQAPEFSIPAR